ncbi:MAG: adenosylcobinamide-phosphate synthase CbiB [Tannerellaceae bacterium]
MTEQFLYTIIPVLIGFTIDCIIGDPYKMPHPIRLFGNVIAFMEALLNQGTRRKVKGILTCLLLVAATWGIFSVLQFMLSDYPILLYAFNSLFFFYGISNKSLIDEGMKVERFVQQGDLPGAREQLSWIVGRETSSLSFTQIRTATLETLSENLSDGVVAPMFYYAIGGIPLMMAYKMINTLDSMVGYKSERYRNFGFCSARLDDVANYIPARLTAFLMLIVPFSLRGFRFVKKYGHKHASPNSGYPESALAGILDCRFGGPNTYHGKVVDKPYIGTNDRELTHEDVQTACRVNLRVALIMVVVTIAVEALLAFA